MVRWHYQLNRHESEQTPRESERQGSLVCRSCKKQDMTQQVNNNKIITKTYSTIILDDLNILSLNNNNKVDNRLCDNFM